MESEEPPVKRPACGERVKVRVTGGSGLVGRALQEVVAADPQPNEEWIFLSLKDGDLR